MGLSEKHCVMTENRGASVACFVLPQHTEGVNEWGDGEGKHVLAGQGSHFTPRTGAQSTRTAPWLAVLMFLTLAFHLLAVLEPCTLC